MKAMVLAAGRGQRMMPLTRDIPKPLLKVAGKYLIEHQLEKLAAAGFCEIIINVSWLGEKIVSALGKGEKYGVNIRYSIEDEPLETAGAIYHAKELLGNNPFVLINADIWTDFPLSSFTNLTLLSDCLAHIVLVNNPDHNSLGDYCLDKKGFVEAKPGYRDTKNACAVSGPFTFSGISVIHPDLVMMFPEKQKKMALRDVFAWGISNRSLNGQIYSGAWSDIGTRERLIEIRNSLKNQESDKK